MKTLKGKKLLVVEDDDMLREMMVELFLVVQADVFQASNGRDAFKIINEFPIDVVVSDVRMPNGDGIELARNIHAIPGKKPLMFICSGFHDMTQEMITQLNITKVFAKPFDRKDLTSTIINSLSK